MLGLLNNIFLIGALFGVLLEGGLADKIRRRKVMFLTDYLAIACALGLLVVNLPVLLVFRFIAGVVSGLYNAIGAIVLSEIMPNVVCGFGNALGYTLVTVSILFSYLLPVMFKKSTLIENANIFLAITILVPIIRQLTIPFMMKHDTAKYIYNMHPDKERANILMQQAYAEVYSPESVHIVTGKAIDCLTREEQTGKVTFRKLFSAKYRTRLYSGVFVCVALQLSGINYLIFYSTELFRKSGKDKAMTIVVGLSNVAGSLVALYAIRHLGRKFSIVWGVLAQGIGMFLLFVGFKTDSFFILAIDTVLYVSAFAVGLGGNQMAYVAEVLPPLGVSIACAVQWILTALVAQLIYLLIELLEPQWL